MGRRIWIIAKKSKITSRVRANAILNGCPEIALGVPPVLEGKVGALPCTFEEPDSPLAIDEPTKLDELESRIKDLELSKRV